MTAETQGERQESSRIGSLELRIDRFHIPKSDRNTSIIHQ